LIRIAIQGTYRAKFALDLFGKRVTLWSKSGPFREAIDLGSGLRASRRHDFGPFEVFADVDERTLKLGVTVSNGRIELWSHQWPLDRIIGNRRTGLNIKARGLEVKAEVTLSQVDREAA